MKLKPLPLVKMAELLKKLVYRIKKLISTEGLCALGHPIGGFWRAHYGHFTLYLQKNNLQRGIASLCIGGG
ncbi:hypothetical protein [Candidatus Coxiella mudrowiae]|uniref:hypothetical protein n=1 Tax=Candidatus Coxiella mudrowiae TaxID=2054173 RepID=UPI001FD46DCE|nr:hypothetical protein [Candidatus Coxiella mudrowiae]